MSKKYILFYNNCQFEINATGVTSCSTALDLNSVSQKLDIACLNWPYGKGLELQFGSRCTLKKIFWGQRWSHCGQSLALIFYRANMPFHHKTWFRQCIFFSLVTIWASLISAITCKKEGRAGEGDCNHTVGRLLVNTPVGLILNKLAGRAEV